MADTVGLTTASTLPNDRNDLLKLIVLELRVMSIYLKEMSGASDEPERLRQLLAKSTEVVVS